jgi:hypothetical protein
MAIFLPRLYSFGLLEEITDGPHPPTTVLSPHHHVLPPIPICYIQVGPGLWYDLANDIHRFRLPGSPNAETLQKVDVREFSQGLPLLIFTTASMRR